MKKIIGGIILLLLLLTPLWSYLFWLFQPAKDTETLLLYEADDQPSALEWVLTHEKYAENQISVIDTSAGELPDITYFIPSTDTIGNPDPEEYLKDLYQEGKLVIAEAGTSITQVTDLKGIFGTAYSGWRGKYFPSLSSSSDDIPIEIKEQYGQFTSLDYDFPESPGIIMLSDEGQVLVLESDVHLEVEVPVIQSSGPVRSQFELPQHCEYYGWFEVHSDTIEENLISTFKLHTNAAGDSLLRQHGLSNTFPAVIGSYSAKHYYFCGDFSNATTNPDLAKFKGIDLISRLFYDDEETGNQKFFWEYYRPLMSNILSSYKLDLSSLEDTRTLPADSVFETDTMHFEADTVINEQSESPGKIPKAPNDENSKQWFVIIGSLPSMEKAEKMQSTNSELQIHHVPELNTYRVAYGPFPDLRQAQMKQSEVMERFPNTWISRF